MQRPSDIDEYRKWLKESQGVEITRKSETYHDTVAAAILESFKHSPFWNRLTESIPVSNQEYYLGTRYNLIDQSFKAELCRKPFNSLLEKSYRVNVLNNKLWPDAPTTGWLLPSNWYSSVRDVVRTYFVVKYLDGVAFLSQKFSELAAQEALETRTDFEAKEEGYYAAHFYVRFECSYPDERWDEKSELVTVEIQITTQLQEVIRRLLHKHYESRRVGAAPNQQWQWDYHSEEFSANYLGHILHYVEGMIMDVRDRPKDNKHED